MSYKLLRPKVTSVPSAVWAIAKISWLFWVLVVAAFLAVFLFSNFWLFATVGLYFVSMTNKVRDSFWEQVANINGWEYKGTGDLGKEAGIMFKQGYNGSRAISRNIYGKVDGRQFRVFNYQFSVGSGKNKETFFYTVFAFRFNGTFPNIYLNNRHNSYSIKIGEKLPLPSEFEKKFALSTAREYEIEALEIFTPDVLAKLLDNGFDYDVEFIGQEVLMFADGVINSFEQLEKEFNRAMALEDLLDEKLDRFKFQQIGDMSPNLK